MTQPFNNLVVFVCGQGHNIKKSITCVTNNAQENANIDDLELPMSRKIPNDYLVESLFPAIIISGFLE